MIMKARLAAQIGVVVALTAGVATLADWPRYHQIGPQSAVVKLSFTHASNRQAECRITTTASKNGTERCRFYCHVRNGLLGVALGGPTRFALGFLAGFLFFLRLFFRQTRFLLVSHRR